MTTEKVTAGFWQLQVICRRRAGQLRKALRHVVDAMVVIGRDARVCMEGGCWPAMAGAVDFGEDSRLADQTETAQRLTT